MARNLLKLVASRRQCSFKPAQPCLRVRLTRQNQHPRIIEIMTTRFVPTATAPAAGALPGRLSVTGLLLIGGWLHGVAARLAWTWRDSADNDLAQAFGVSPMELLIAAIAAIGLYRGAAAERLGLPALGFVLLLLVPSSLAAHGVIGSVRAMGRHRHGRADPILRAAVRGTRRMRPVERAVSADRRRLAAAGRCHPDAGPAPDACCPGSSASATCWASPAATGSSSWRDARRPMACRWCCWDWWRCRCATAGCRRASGAPRWGWRRLHGCQPAAPDLSLAFPTILPPWAWPVWGDAVRCAGHRHAAVLAGRLTRGMPAGDCGDGPRRAGRPDLGRGAARPAGPRPRHQSGADRRTAAATAGGTGAGRGRGVPGGPGLAPGGAAGTDAGWRQHHSVLSPAPAAPARWLSPWPPARRRRHRCCVWRWAGTCAGWSVACCTRSRRSAVRR